MAAATSTQYPAVSALACQAHATSPKLTAVATSTSG